MTRIPSSLPGFWTTTTLLVGLLLTLPTSGRAQARTSGRAQAPAPGRAQAPTPGKVEFTSSHEELNRGFSWAKGQALAYAFEGDPVGMWFEAALPGREAFCMRDVSHQAQGAMALGLQPHTKNMFRKFAESISPSRDWAGYWEINRYDLPAPVDYRNDEDFWYNLPANFDVIQAIYRVFEWTGDTDYLNDSAFLDFYRHSLTDYVRAWDPDDDGFMESPPENGIRGIPTYWEGEGPKALTGADLVAAQFAANKAYSRILALRGELGEAEAFAASSRRLEEIYNRDWWNPDTQRFNTAILPNGTFDSSPLPLGQLYPLFFGIVPDGPRRRAMVEKLPNGEMVELNAYFPEILYRNGDYEGAFQSLLVQLDPTLARREYPEVSYTAVGHIVSFLMGVQPLASQGVVETKSRLSDEIRWAEVSNVPIMVNEISVKHIGGAETHLRNETGEALIWRAVFAGQHLEASVDGRSLALSHRESDGEGAESFLEVTVAPGMEVVVRVSERG